MRDLEDHYGPLVTRLIRQVDCWTQQLHWYLLIHLITVPWSAAHRGLQGSSLEVLYCSKVMTFFYYSSHNHTDNPYNLCSPARPYFRLRALDPLRAALRAGTVPVPHLADQSDRPTQHGCDDPHGTEPVDGGARVGGRSHRVFLLTPHPSQGWHVQKPILCKL